MDNPTLGDVERWPATVSVVDASLALGISKSLGYDLARRGEFPAKVMTVGNRRRVITASLIAALRGE